MKKILLIVITIALLAGCTASSRRPASSKAQDRRKIEGTWELRFDKAPELKEIKVLNRSHFVWVTYEYETGMPVALGGGTYRFDGRKYVERLEFMSPHLSRDLLDKDQEFSAEIKGDHWYHNGVLSDGSHVNEHWKRVR